MTRSQAVRYGTIAIIGIVTMFVVLPAACGGLGGGDDDDDSVSEFASIGAMAQPTATTGGASFADTTTSGGATARPDQAAAAPADWDRMVVRNASITLIVTDVEGAVGWVRGIASAKGGFVFSSSSSVNDDRQVAQLTLRVPVERFDETMSELRAGQLVDEVEREESSAQDVSAEFVDNQSRLAALQTTYDRLLSLLGQAESVEDILRLEFELQNVRTEIETIQGRQNYLQNATSFSTIAVSLFPPGAPPKPDEPSFSVSTAFANAWERARGTVEGTVTAAITIVIFTLVFAPVAALLYIVFRVGRLVMRRVAGETP
jgi:hypothetical protein